MDGPALRAAPAPAASVPLPTLPEVDALRGVAITLVMLYHVDIFTGGQVLETPGHTSLLGAVLHGGHTGASLFFVLSGFLLTTPFVREAAGGAHVSRRTYAARRFWRIMPLYAVAVAVASVRCATRPADVLRGVRICSSCTRSPTRRRG